MKIAVISYSLTGNNETLAKSIAQELSAEHIKITEPKPRNTGSIIMDVIFNKTPKVGLAPDRLKNYDLILFVAPIWMGKVASPLRAYLKYIQANPLRYGFISISGGAIGSNTKLADELKKRTGKDPAVLIDKHIADLLPSDPKPDMKATASFRLNGEDSRKLTDSIVKSIRQTTLK